MTPQPAPGAAVVQRDARTIPRCERRDGRRIATPTSDEVPEFLEPSLATRTSFADVRLLLSWFVPTPPSTEVIEWVQFPTCSGEAQRFRSVAWA